MDRTFSCCPLGSLLAVPVRAGAPLARCTATEGAATDKGAQVYDALGALGECVHCGLGGAPSCDLESVYAQLETAGELAQEQRSRSEHPGSTPCVFTSVDGEAYSRPPERLRAKCADIQ